MTQKLEQLGAEEQAFTPPHLELVKSIEASEEPEKWYEVECPTIAEAINCRVNYRDLWDKYDQERYDIESNQHLTEDERKSRLSELSFRRASEVYSIKDERNVIMLKAVEGVLDRGIADVNNSIGEIYRAYLNIDVNNDPNEAMILEWAGEMLMKYRGDSPTVSLGNTALRDIAAKDAETIDPSAEQYFYVDPETGEVRRAGPLHLV